MIIEGRPPHPRFPALRPASAPCKVIYLVMDVPHSLRAGITTASLLPLLRRRATARDSALRSPCGQNVRRHICGRCLRVPEASRDASKDPGRPEPSHPHPRGEQAPRSRPPGPVGRSRSPWASCTLNTMGARCASRSSQPEKPTVMGGLTQSITSGRLERSPATMGRDTGRLMRSMYRERPISAA